MVLLLVLRPRLRFQPYLSVTIFLPPDPRSTFIRNTIRLPPCVEWAYVGKRPTLRERKASFMLISDTTSQDVKFAGFHLARGRYYNYNFGCFSIPLMQN
jgi:hypothetical protein